MDQISYIFNDTITKNVTPDTLEIHLIMQIENDNALDYFYGCYDRASKIQNNEYSQMITDYITNYALGEFELTKFFHKFKFYAWVCLNANKINNLLTVMAKENKINIQELFCYSLNTKFTDLSGLFLIKEFRDISGSYKNKQTGIEEQKSGLLRFVTNYTSQELINNIVPLVDDSKSCERLVEYLDVVLNLNVQHSQYNAQMSIESNTKSCSGLEFLQKIHDIILYIQSKYISEIYTHTMPFPRNILTLDTHDSLETKIMILACKALNICHMPLYEEILHPNIFNFGNKNTNKYQKYINEITNKVCVSIEHIIASKIHISDEVILNILNKNIYDKELKIQNKIITQTDFLFSVLETTKNPHLKYLAAENIISHVKVTKYNDHGKLILLCKYINETDIFKYLQLQKAHEHFNNIVNIIHNISKDMSKDIISNNQFIIMKGIHKICSKILDFFEQVSQHCEKLKEHPSYKDYQRTDRQSTKRDLKAESIQFIKINITSIINCFGKLNIIVANMIDKEEINKLEYELILPMINIITESIKKLGDGKNPLYFIYDQSDEGGKILVHSLEFINLIKENENFNKEITVYKNEIQTMLKHVKMDKQLLNDLTIYFLEHTDNTEDNELPGEFIDQLTCVMIKNPIMIPNVDLIFDKSSIISQLFYDKINPYTREPLCIEQVDEYNKQDNVQNKINTFKEKYMAYKLQKK